MDPWPWLLTETDIDIYFMSPEGLPGVDEVPTVNNLENALTTWAKASTRDVVVYMVGKGGYQIFQMDSGQIVQGAVLNTWLDSLQEAIPGKVTVIFDACGSGSLIPMLVPPEGKERILISSASYAQSAYFVSEGDISFSNFFWNRVLNGANVRNAFTWAADAIRFACKGQTPQMDDNGNGVCNEKADGTLSKNYTIGTGIMLAADDPIIGSVSDPQNLAGEKSTVLWAKNVTTTGAINKVWAVITPPGYGPGLCETPEEFLPTVDLTHIGGGRYEGNFSGWSSVGTYEVAVHAMDQDGNVSLPAGTTVTQAVVLEPCKECIGDKVEPVGVTFKTGTNWECTAATSITIGPGVRIESGATVTFKAPTVKIQSGFEAQAGSVVRIKQE